MKTLILIVFILSFINMCGSQKINLKLSKIDNSQIAEMEIDSLRFLKGFVLDTLKINSRTGNFNLYPRIVDSFLVENNKGIVFQLLQYNRVENTISLFVIGTVQDTLVNLYYNEYGEGSWHWRLFKVEHFNIDAERIEIKVILEPIQFALTEFLDFCCDENGGYKNVNPKFRLEIKN